LNLTYQDCQSRSPPNGIGLPDGTEGKGKGLDAVKSLNQSLRNITKTTCSFPCDNAAMKLLHLAINNAGIRRKR
jgi:hypothetical protein